MESTFSESFAKYQGGGFSLPVSSGTGAIYVSPALLGLPKGSTILTSTVTCSAVLGSIQTFGFVPKVVDSALRSFNVDAEQVKARISKDLRGLLVTHASGEPVDVPAIREATKDDSILILEVCSQATAASILEANIGHYSIMAAKFLRTTVYAVEIDHVNTRMLYGNIYMNNYQEKVTVLPFGLDSISHQEKPFLKTMSYGDALHNLREPNAMVLNPSSVQMNAPVFSLDDLIKILRLPSPTKLKIVVDGVDFHVLKGSTNALTTVSSLVIEYMPNSATKTEIHNFLFNHGLPLDLDLVGVRIWGTVDGFFSEKS